MIKQLLDEKSSISMMRLMSLISLSIGSFLAIAGLYKGSDLMGLSALCSVFILAAFGGKAAQKMIEVKDA
jgi:hypothetical protein